MFQRAHKGTAELSDYANAVADVLNGGAESIGSARIALLDKAIDIERGPLYVTNEWVVSIREAIRSPRRRRNCRPSRKPNSRTSTIC